MRARGRVLRGAAVLALVAATGVLGGCGVSLFSRHETDAGAQRRLLELEQRMDRVEERLRSGGPTTG